MKLTTFILFAALMQVSAAGVAQRLTLVQKNVTLKQVFSEINRQTGYSIVWSVSQLRGNMQVDVDFKNAPLLEALDKCLENTNLTYTIENKTVVIREKEPTIIGRIKDHLAQITIAGKVTDETGLPLPGVTVKEKGTANGVITDSKGMFSLTVPVGKAIITFSFVGFETQELLAIDLVGGAIVRMKAITNNLKEVVINKGYYNTTQELNTGNASIVKGEDIAKQPVSDPILALEGRVPGLFVRAASGLPGAPLVVNLRGQNSIANGNNPLYIVDGVPFTSTSITSDIFGAGPLAYISPFSSLDPANIENIVVLKDADATAIYGSRGANGVILITTTKGKPNQTIVDLNFNSGVGRVAHFMDFLNTPQYLEMRHEAFKNDGKIPGSGDYDVNGKWDTTRYTDWQKVFIGGTARITNAQINISGGTANTQFLVGGGYVDQTTIFPGNFSDQKASAHFNVSHNSADQKFHLLFSANYVNDYNVMPGQDFTNFIALAPDAPTVYDNNGNLNWQSNTWVNPFAAVMTVAKSVTNNLISNINLSYEIFPGLLIKGTAGYSLLTGDQASTTPLSSINPSLIDNSSGETQYAANRTSTVIFEPQLSYKKEIGSSNLNILLGATFQENKTNNFSIDGYGYTNDAFIGNVYAAANTVVEEQNNVQYKYNAIYGRINYDFDKKYLFNFTARRDGSSRFGPDKQFGNFWAVGAGWIFSKEHFLGENADFISFGKLRASYGITGNDQFQDYQYLSSYSPYVYNYQGVPTLSPNNLYNPSYGWETVKKFEVGLELGFFRDRIFFSADYFRNRTGNQLVGYSLPSITGFSSVIANLPAIIENSGTEFSLNTTIFRSTSFRWTTALNLTIPKNELVSYPNLASSSYANTYAIGQPLSMRKGYHITGVNPQTGTYTFQDINKDGRISYPNDIGIIPAKTQTFFGGLQNAIGYKKWQLDLIFQFVKQTGFTYTNNFLPPGYFGGLYNKNQPTAVLNRWQKPGDNTNIEKFTTGFGTSAYNAYYQERLSNGGVGDASFVRLQNISLSYQVPDGWARKIDVKSCRFYALWQNVFTITKYIGLDPETRALTVPPLRIITFGVQISL